MLVGWHAGGWRWGSIRVGYGGGEGPGVAGRHSRGNCQGKQTASKKMPARLLF